MNKNLIHILWIDKFKWGVAYYNLETKQRIPPHSLRYHKDKDFYTIEGTDLKIKKENVLEL